MRRWSSLPRWSSSRFGACGSGRRRSRSRRSSSPRRRSGGRTSSCVTDSASASAAAAPSSARRAQASITSGGSPGTCPPTTRDGQRTCPRRPTRSHGGLCALLIACMIVVPGTAFVVAKLHSSASPEARHLIFALPFFSTLLATPLAAVGRLRTPVTLVAAGAAVAVLVVGEARWAERKTPPLFDGDPPGEAAARDRAADWLAADARPDDVLLGYEPVYLRAWEQNRSFSRHALPRADPELLAKALKDVPEPVGRGIWVFDASDTTNVWERQTIRFVLPGPASAFEGRVYGPFLVIRSRRPLRTRQRFLDVSERVMQVGRTLRIGDADVNLHSLLVAESRFF